jgi:hypothetical protein
MVKTALAGDPVDGRLVSFLLHVSVMYYFVVSHGSICIVALVFSSSVRDEDCVAKSDLDFCSHQLGCLGLCCLLHLHLGNVAIFICKHPILVC